MKFKSRLMETLSPKNNIAVIQPLSHVQLFATPWTVAHQVSLSTLSQSLLKLMSIESVMPSNHMQSLIIPFKMKVEVLVPQLCPTLQSHGLQPTRFLSPWDSPGKKTDMGSHSVLQGIFPTHRSNPGLPYYRQILYHLSHQTQIQIIRIYGFPFKF